MRSPRNMKFLDANLLKFAKENYKFDIMGDFVVVTAIKLNRKCLHPIDENFYIKIYTRKLTITKDTISLWMDKYKNECSLIELQNAINQLVLTYQNVNDTNIKSILKGNCVTINNY